MTAAPQWAVLIVEAHAPAAYACAALFPALRWARRRFADQRTHLGSIIHQAATGFVVPAFVMLLFSYKWPELVTHVSPHELGIAGLIALITSLRELCVDGVEDEGRFRNSRSFL